MSIERGKKEEADVGAHDEHDGCLTSSLSITVI